LREVIEIETFRKFSDGNIKPKEVSSMSKNYTDFKEKFRLSELVIAETEHWNWSVRPAQATVGSGILSAKRPVEAFSEITEEESADLGKMIKIIEGALKKKFSYNRINYLMLMMVDFHVHFHVIPRYDRDIEFSGITWNDKGWPKPPILDAESVSDEVLLAVRDELKKSIN
jgi:diadenosine tetraphosphate (Ap4A) HIT family hydrolase